MKKLSFCIRDARGLHARPACLLASTGKQFSCAATLHCKTGTANAKELFELLDLQVTPGTELWLELDGADKDAALKALKNAILAGFPDAFE